MVGEESVCDVIGLPLCFVSIVCHLERCGHDPSVIDQAMEGCLCREKALFCVNYAGKREVVDLQECDVCTWVKIFDARNGGIPFGGGTSAEVNMGAVFRKMGHGVKVSVNLSAVCGKGDDPIHHSGEPRRATYMPEFPPVTMYTLPKRPGNGSGLNFILEITSETADCYSVDRFLDAENGRPRLNSEPRFDLD
jgi:hypothetical protein